ncbi:precorrin-6y C5,15-methyltransferase (decarboxylating) subunit CbiE [Williamsia sp. MIQD14]|uniref:precorrin-6y C5,15-methyltransferase (decarboxylating) subunit CbiE n=1 Tax=Williamsia sp. MIQD14 TaxID=3425703 RepID=UPI003D9FDEAE
MTVPDVVVVGIGADGWRGLSPIAHDELTGATTIAGSRRQLDLLPDLSARTRAWSTPMLADLRALLADPPSRPLHVLASGDPMFHGVGATIVGLLGAERVRVIPAVSSASLAAARLGWDLARTEVVSLVTDPVETILAHVSDGVRLLLLSRDANTPAAVATILRDNGFGASTVTVLECLGGDDEASASADATDWGRPPGQDLNVVAVSCRGPKVSTAPGRPDADFDSDGQLTKSGVRSLTLALLRPAPHEMLWDVGGGAGSVSCEWLVAEPTARAVVFETDPGRRERIARNAARLGVTARLQIVGEAPAALHDAPRPDAVFVGGGVTVPGMIETCWDALAPGSRLVVNAVTLESEMLVLDRQRSLGGDLRRIHLDHAAALGTMTTWRPILPVTQWSAVKPEETS